MAEPDQTDPTLADVLRALGDVLRRGEAAGVHVDAATLELDLVVAATADGGVDLRVAKVPVEGTRDDGESAAGRTAGGGPDGGRPRGGKRAEGKRGEGKRGDGGPKGSKRGGATRLTVTVRPGPGATPDGATGDRSRAQGSPVAPGAGAGSATSAAAGPGAGAGGSAGAGPRPGTGHAPEPAPVRSPGLIDLLADAIKSLAESASTAPASTWPLRPLPRDDRGEGMGPRRAE